MIAQVRPLRPEYAAPPLRHLWGIVLSASTTAERASPPRRRAPAVGLARSSPGGGPLRRSLDQASRLIPAARLVTVLTRDTAAEGEEASTLPGHHCIQPSARGTAPEMFLAALGVLQRDPHAIVAALPADHLIEHGPRLMHCVSRAAAAAAVRGDLPVIVGAYPGSHDPEWASVEPGELVEGLEAFGVHTVRRFITLPATADRSAGLLGALAVVVSARALVALGHRYIPEVMESLEPLERAIGHAEAALLCDALWESMPRASLCRDVLALVEYLGVVSLPDAMTGERARPVTDALAS